MNCICATCLCVTQCSSLSQPPSQRIHTEICLTDNEWKIAQREIDWSIENFFGYTFLDCHLCYGPKSAARGKGPPVSPLLLAKRKQFDVNYGPKL